MIRRAAFVACMSGVVLSMTAVTLDRALAAERAPSQAPAAFTQQGPVDDNDDTRVEVQLVVLGIAVGTVFVVGTGAFLLRRKLGLVAPPPEPDAGGHH